MKNGKVFLTSLLLLFSFALTRCTPDTTGFVPSTEEVLVRNTWAVDYYFQNQDMTNSFSSSKLLFSSTGAVGYQKNAETIPGNWSKTVDAASNELIILHFNTNDVTISRLNGSWKLTARSSGSLQFEEGGGTSHVLFRIRMQ